MVSVPNSGVSAPGFEPWQGTLCCVLGQDTLLSQCLSPPRCINGVPANLMLGVTTETRICSDLMSRLACMQTLPYWNLVT